MITFDKDVEAQGRINQPTFYGFIPDDHILRRRCFMLLTMMSTLHNLSRSIGCALLMASGGGTMILSVYGGEMLLYAAWKLFRRDFMAWFPVEGAFGILMSLLYRVVVKVIVDFSGCLLFRHPNELGGCAFSLSTVWAQIMPFVALWLYERRESDVGGDNIETENGENNMANTTSLLVSRIESKVEMSTIRVTLTCSFALWLLNSVAFFCTINLAFVNTFFGLQTASQYTIGIFLTSDDDSAKFRAAFKKRASYTKPILGNVKTWVEENIDRWREEKEDWFQADKVPDEFLPVRVQLAEGGASRRRSSGVSIKELAELMGGRH